MRTLSSNSPHLLRLLPPAELELVTSAATAYASSQAARIALRAFQASTAIAAHVPTLASPMSAQLLQTARPLRPAHLARAGRQLTTCSAAPMRILGVSGSIRKGSNNTKLLEAAKKVIGDAWHRALSISAPVGRAVVRHIDTITLHATSFVSCERVPASGCVH